MQASGLLIYHEMAIDVTKNRTQFQTRCRSSKRVPKLHWTRKGNYRIYKVKGNNVFGIKPPVIGC